MRSIANRRCSRLQICVTGGRTTFNFAMGRTVRYPGRGSLRFEAFVMILPGMPMDSAKRRHPSGPKELWKFVAWATMTFSILVGLVVLGGHIGNDGLTPLQSPPLKELKEKLRARPEDEGLKQQIRALDLGLRQHYFLQLSRLNSGVYLLLGGVAV